MDDMPEAGSTLNQVVEILLDLDVVEFNESGPWPGPPGDADQVCDVDLSQVWPTSGSEAAAPLDQVGPNTWDEIGERLREIASRGPSTPPPIIDALAWYLPIHFYGEEAAIYMREDGLLDIAARMITLLPERRRGDPDAAMGACRSAFTVLFLHEAFHHKIESFAIRGEVVEQRRLYVPYVRNVTMPLLQRGSDEVIEEAIACAEMITRLGEPKYKRGIGTDILDARIQHLRSWIPQLGPSYRRGLEFVPKERHDDGVRQLQSHVQEGTITPLRDPRHWRAAPQMDRGILNFETLTKVIVPIGTEPLIPWFSPPFRGTISSRAVLRVLTTHFDYAEQVKRGKGSHRRLTSPTLATQTVPDNREALSVGVVKNIAANAGITAQELIDLGRGR